MTNADVRRWWSERPNADIAIITGKISGLVVLDSDTEEATKYIQQRETVYNSIRRSINYDLKQQPKASQLEVLLHGKGLRSGHGRSVAEHFQYFLQTSGRFAGDY